MTAPLLESYAAGRWYAAPDDGTPIADAVTGETVARISSGGLDVAAMVDHARTVGGPALRELTFHQRAGLLKALGLRLLADKGACYALSRRTGATDRDSAVDVDGGFGTLLSYASKGRRELPDDTVVLDGAVEPLGRAGTFVGQHLYTPLRGGAAGGCRMPPSPSAAGWGRWAGRARSSASTCTRRCAGSPCRSTRSTSPSGASWRSWPRPSSPACRRS